MDLGHVCFYVYKKNSSINAVGEESGPKHKFFTRKFAELGSLFYDSKTKSYNSNRSTSALSPSKSVWKLRIYYVDEFLIILRSFLATTTRFFYGKFTSDSVKTIILNTARLPETAVRTYNFT